MRITRVWKTLPYRDLDLNKVTLTTGDALLARCDSYGFDEARLTLNLLLPGTPPELCGVMSVPQDVVPGKDFLGDPLVEAGDEPDTEVAHAADVPMSRSVISALPTGPLTLFRGKLEAEGDLEVLAHSWRAHRELLIFSIEMNTTPPTHFDIASIPTRALKTDATGSPAIRADEPPEEHKLLNLQR